MSRDRSRSPLPRHSETRDGEGPTESFLQEDSALHSDDDSDIIYRNDAAELDDDLDTSSIPPRRKRGRAPSFTLYTPDEERTVLRRLDRRLVLFVALLYLLSFLDRSNIGNARIAGLTEDLNLDSAQYEGLLTAFYVTYVLFEWMTLLYSVLPPHVYVALCVASWGLIASLQSVATSFGMMLLLRAALGIAEAAFGPGVPFYMSFFFRREELAFRTGLFISAAPLATSFASSLAWAITYLADRSPFAAWRLLFLIEGFPSMIVAVFAWIHLPDSPETAKFLTVRQRKVAALRLRDEREHQRTPSGPKKRLAWREIGKTLVDPKAYLTAVCIL
jgi:phosphatidylinositol 3,5-bisphosphate 5-phosphatase